jgi:hypothetical protein
MKKVCLDISGRCGSVLLRNVQSTEISVDPHFGQKLPKRNVVWQRLQEKMECLTMVMG